MKREAYLVKREALEAGAEHESFNSGTKYDSSLSSLPALLVPPALHEIRFTCSLPILCTVD